jgi:hypothetical protein
MMKQYQVRVVLMVEAHSAEEAGDTVDTFLFEEVYSDANPYIKEYILVEVENE